MHPVVKRDFGTWAGGQEGDYVILESAILFESGFDALVDRTVAVLAPAALRIERACRRDKCDPEAVRRRIAAQLDDEALCARADFSVVNILESDLEPAVAQLDGMFRLESPRYHAD